MSMNHPANCKQEPQELVRRLAPTRVGGGHGKVVDEEGGAPAARRLSAPTAGGAVGAMGRAVLVVPGAGLAAALGALAIGYLLYDDAANRLVTAGLLLPLLWGLAGYWLSAARRLAPPLAVLALAAIGGAVFLALGVSA